MHNLQNMMDVNYFGSIFATRAVIPEMKIRRQGHIVYLSSQAGQLGMFGYTGYSPAKFALRGLAEALQMEVCHCKELILVACVKVISQSIDVYSLCFLPTY